MSRIAVFLADGFEEIEALAPVDLCRRAGVEVVTVSVMETRTVMGSHAIPVQADKLLAEVDFASLDMLVLPGGKEGTKNLEACAPLMEQVERFNGEKKCLSAICAAPSILAHRGFLRGRNACCHPSFEGHLADAAVSANPVEVSDHITTARGMGASIEFGLAIVERFMGREKADEVAGAIVYR